MTQLYSAVKGLRGMPCSQSTAERQYQDELSRSDEIEAIASQMARARAYDDLSNAAKLKSLVLDYELDVFPQLARVMSNLDSACRGQEIGVTAVLTALSQIQSAALAKESDIVLDDCREDASHQIMGWEE